MLRDLLSSATHDPVFVALAREGGRAFVSRSLRPYLVAALLEREPRPTLVVTGDDRSAQELAGDLHSWLAPRSVRFYPSRGVTYESHLTPPPHLVGLRIAALDSLLGRGQVRGLTPQSVTVGSDRTITGSDPGPDPTPPVVVASAVALSEKVPDPALRPHGFTLKVGELLDLDECATELVAAGYERVDQVSERGQFAVRGGLLDLFGATEEHAVRVDLFDVEIESLRYFSTFTQRSLGEAEVVEVAPAAELDSERREAAELAVLECEDERPDITELLPLNDFHPLLALLPDTTEFLVAAEEEIVPALRDSFTDVVAAFHDEQAHSLYLPPAEITETFERQARIWLSAIEQEQPYSFPAQAADLAARKLADAETELERHLRSGYRTVVTWPTRGDGERAVYGLTRLRANWPEVPQPDDELTFVAATLASGFIAPQFKLAVFPSHRLLRRRRERRARPAGRGVLRSFADLQTGDFVVHEDHGVARFAGFETKTVAGVTRDYLYLEYQGEDRVFVPSEQLAKISRYVGAGGEEPKLSKLGGTRWEQIKARARRAAQELAGDLLNIYATRKSASGYAFPEDSDWQRQFEAAFPYSETPDQREAIEQCKADMESERPMDRLICGDVGFGKTEVALRAAFKAANDGKQVLLLAPTTILAQQHFGTFTERLRDYPFTIDLVSRFRSTAEQRTALNGFSEGKVDILIGTHRVLSRDVMPKELGLVILDEEQRFGVKQKELLRQLKLKVDVLAMSATPIPRTLQMSLAGIRDISVIETPPEGRRPVKTYVGEYDEQLVKNALERELERGGQAFFMHNRVETIDETALRLRALCPQARIAVAHGQLEEAELEQRMLFFLRGESDVLVCTSIIESGLDIPQANTLIVESSQLFGLSQLYQIRGRVGRASQRAYAYLLYPSAAALTQEAAQRLAALSDFTELGAGLKIAMRDLEIRGAGDLLGDEQSGHVAALGFELYMQLLDEAVAELSADEEAAVGAELVRLDVAVDAYVPTEYIPYEKAKIDTHRRIASAVELEQLGRLSEELADRFGPLPEPLENLIALQQARIKFGLVGARDISFKGGRLVVTPIELDSKAVKQIRTELPEALYESGRSQFSLRVADDPKAHFPALRRAADLLLAASNRAK